MTTVFPEKSVCVTTEQTDVDPVCLNHDREKYSPNLATDESKSLCKIHNNGKERQKAEQNFCLAAISYIFSAGPLAFVGSKQSMYCTKCTDVGLILCIFDQRSPWLISDPTRASDSPFFPHCAYEAHS